MSDNRAELAAALIRVFEGCKLLPYRDTGGILTVGYGHAGETTAPLVHQTSLHIVPLPVEFALARTAGNCPTCLA